MLFVRSGEIPGMVGRAPLVAAGMIAVVLAVSPQYSLGATRTLDVTLYRDGLAHVSSTTDIDPLGLEHAADLFGTSVDSLVAVDENGLLLTSEIAGGFARIEAFGSHSVTLDYDIHDLISKEGRVWTFSLDAPVGYSLLMPRDSIIVGMSSLPLSMELEGERTRIDLPGGSSEINYIFGISGMHHDDARPGGDAGLGLALVGIPAAAAAAGAAVLVMRRRAAGPVRRPAAPDAAGPPDAGATGPPDADAILELRPEMREDDKEIVRFLSRNGGSALEGDLRRAFLQPRTTMWRAVKRLERQGVIEIDKKDQQNLVRLRGDIQ